MKCLHIKYNKFITVIIMNWKNGSVGKMLAALRATVKAVCGSLQL